VDKGRSFGQGERALEQGDGLPEIPPDAIQPPETTGRGHQAVRMIDRFRNTEPFLRCGDPFLELATFTKRPA
jgi:hypothetical protein